MKTIWPVKMGDEALVWLFVWIGGDCLHMVQLMPLPSRNPIISCIIFSDWFDLLVSAYPGCPGKEAVKWV